MLILQINQCFSRASGTPCWHTEHHNSECTINPALAPILPIACFRADDTNSLFIRLSIAHQTSFLPCKTITPARYSHPSSVPIYVMSDTHLSFGLSDAKSWFNRFSATGRLWFEFVVALPCISLQPLTWSHLNESDGPHAPHWPFDLPVDSLLSLVHHKLSGCPQIFNNSAQKLSILLAAPAV